MKILIGSCGGLTGLYLAKEFKKNISESIIYGIDSIDAYSTIKYLDNFLLSPKAKEEKDFISFLIKTLNDENIEYYFPTHSNETKLISKYEKEIREKTKTKFIISTYDTYLAIDNKKNANLNLKKIGINVPELYSSKEEIKFPAFVKPSLGSGSNNSFKISQMEDYQYYIKKDANNIFFEYIEGTEYTVDAFFDNSGKLITYNQRIRIKQLGGATIYTKNEFSEYDCYDDLIKISEEFTFKGVVNFQFILRDKKAYYTDINLRYASGGLPLSVESGLNITKFLIDVLNNSTIDKQSFQSDRKNRYMMRYFEEMFVIKWEYL